MTHSGTGVFEASAFVHALAQAHALALAKALVKAPWDEFYTRGGESVALT